MSGQLWQKISHRVVFLCVLLSAVCVLLAALVVDRSPAARRIVTLGASSAAAATASILHSSPASTAADSLPVAHFSNMSADPSNPPAAAAAPAPEADDAGSNQPVPDSFFELKALDAKKKPVDFSEYRGKVVLVVNVASKCGFTPQYKGLEELYKKYKDQGLVILGFPCNGFGSQEPGGEEEILGFCSNTYGVSFPIMAKTEVNGDKEHPVYSFLKKKKSGIMGIKRIKWNFEKFLVDKQGEVVERFSSLTKPEELDGKIAALLAK